jgi:hypothetical protein
MYRRSRSFLVVLVLFIAACSGSNENKISTPVSQNLYAEIAHMDSVMFDAFNAYDVEKLKTTFSDDLEFYHDKGGLSDYKQTMENFSKLLKTIKPPA